jgi:putative membrane protein
MRRFLVRVLVNAIALWVTASIVAGISVTSYGDGGFALVVTYLVVALIFSIVNATIGTAIRIVAFPLYILTLGLLALVVNAALLLLVSWISGLLGFGLTVAGFWPGVVAAIVLGLVAWLLGLVFRPLAGNPNRSR